ncbi:MAG TPA: amidohydrolase, partial [Anaerolineae bacterium]|nr:amidohydrolase [Anaerolineae bacterium]
MPLSTLDPLGGAKYALEGRVVTMNDAGDVLKRGTIYIDAGEIKAALPSNAPAPDGFEDAPIIKTGGTIYPGLIELHNHLSYNVLRLWDVPKQ